MPAMGPAPANPLSHPRGMHGAEDGSVRPRPRVSAVLAGRMAGGEPSHWIRSDWRICCTVVWRCWASWAMYMKTIMNCRASVTTKM